MVNIEKIKYEKGYIFKIYLDEGIFTITFAGNLDLYFNYECSNSILEEDKIKTFKITKENYFLYSIFSKLYEYVKNCNIYSDDEEINLDYKLNDMVRNYEKNNPKRLFQNNIIDFHSDDYSYEDSSRMLIKELEEEIELTFIKGRTDVLPETFAIRICNSGSRHYPFNVLFMQLYNKLIEYEPEFHQIHIEEYLYELKRSRKKDK